MLKLRGCATPRSFILDNETSSLLLNTFDKENNISYQLVPPTSIAEMRLKNPFKLGKSTSLSDCQVCHQTFPIGMGPSYFSRHADP